MYDKIKQLADQAIAVQNKDGMDAALREIAGIAGGSIPAETIIDELMRGKSVMLNGRLVKLVAGEMPLIPPQGQDIRAKIEAAKKGGAK